MRRAEGPWETVWKRHSRFSADGICDKILAELVAAAAGVPAAPAHFP